MRIMTGKSSLPTTRYTVPKKRGSTLTERPKLNATASLGLLPESKPESLYIKNPGRSRRAAEAAY